MWLRYNSSYSLLKACDYVIKVWDNMSKSLIRYEYIRRLYENSLDSSRGERHPGKWCRWMWTAFLWHWVDWLYCHRPSQSRVMPFVVIAYFYNIFAIFVADQSDLVYTAAQIYCIYFVNNSNCLMHLDSGPRLWLKCHCLTSWPDWKMYVVLRPYIFAR